MGENSPRSGPCYETPNTGGVMRLPVWLRWRAEADFEDEIQQHLDLEVLGNMNRGLTLQQARYAALRRFGNQTHLKETVREADPFFGIQTFGRDVLHGLGSLRRAPGFAFVAAVSLAVGIGA